MKWPLMVECISPEEKKGLCDFIMSDSRLSMGEQTKKFEALWSDWQGSKYSLFVNSGSSANLLILAALKEKYFKDRTPKILTAACTWATNISSAMQLGYELVFADIDLDNFGIDVDSVNCGVDVVFVTHLMGIPSNVTAIKRAFPNALIIEDCCESHGTLYRGQKIGTLGLASSFSFYFGHHMTTIEGGMVSTDDYDLYNLMKAKRSHGMVRDLDIKDQVAKDYPDIDDRFLFITDGYNLRSTDLNAVLGISQLSKLDGFIEQRRKNHERFKAILSKYPRFSLPNDEGNSSFCFPFLCSSVEERNGLMKLMEARGIETRPFLVGNILRQPYVQGCGEPTSLPKSEQMHFKSFYIGNHPFLGDEHFNLLEEVLDEYLSL